jgi:DNA-binding HxlR family transcriptional regulator
MVEPFGASRRYRDDVPLGRDYADQDCAIARALEVVGERWTMLVLRDCFFGVRRFTDLRAHLDIPRAVLSDRLATLVDAGVLARRPYAAGREEYVITDDGLALWPALFTLAVWGERHRTGPGGGRRRFRHADCPVDTGADVGPGGLCPACRAVPGPGELEMRVVDGPALDPTDDVVTRALRRPHRLLTPVR